MSVDVHRDAGATVATKVATAMRPRISVILNFYDPRGHAENLETWTRGQTLADDEYEVIAVTTTARAVIAEELRSRLRPQDHLLCLDTNKPFELYAPAVERAQAEILFFSEDHCLARPDCLEAALAYMASGDVVGASTAWGHINGNAVARMEERTCDRDVSTWAREGHWNKLRIRGFVLTRNAYAQVGGFDAAFENFSEALLSAKLHAAGLQIGYLDAGGVEHINTTTFRELFSNVWTYAWNECRFAEANPDSKWDPYVGPTRDWLAEQSLDLPTRAWVLHALGSLLGRQLARPSRWRHARRLLLPWARAFGHRVVGRRAPKLSAYARLGFARLRFALWRFSEDRRYRAFEDYWLRGAACGQADYVARHGVLTSSLPRWRPTALYIDAEGAWGVHPPEHHAGRTFAWTRAASLYSFARPAGSYQVIIGTAGFRRLSARTPLALYWNRHRLADVRVEGEQILATIPAHACHPTGTQRLTLVTSPFTSVFGRETRELGLPLTSIRIHADDTGTQ